MPGTTSPTAELLSNAEYHIEFNGYLTNHAKHAVVALSGLQASPKLIRSYWDAYTTSTPYGLRLQPAESIDPDGQPLTEGTWREVMGRKAPGDFAALQEFFGDQVGALGESETVAKYGSELLQGSVGALTHALIHLGWGIDAGSKCMTIEGLAYLAYSAVDIRPERFVRANQPDESPWQSLLRIADTYHTQNVAQWVHDVKAAEKYSEAAGFHLELVEAGFQREVAKVVAEGHPLMVGMPAWLDDMELSSAVEELYKALTAVYLSTTAVAARPGRHGNFLMLHLLTSMWGLEHVMDRLPGDSDRRFALKCFWAAAVALLLTSGRVPTVHATEAARAMYGEARDTLVEANDGRFQESQGWEEIVDRALAEEEEHNIKLAYVGRELWRRYGRWSGFRLAASTFTETPNIGARKPPFKP